MQDKQTCPECGRDNAIENNRCIYCGKIFGKPEKLNPNEWAILFHNPIKENVEDLQRDLKEHGVDAEVRYINLGDFKISIRSVSTWALLVSREGAAGAYEILHRLYGKLEEPEEEDAEALHGKYGFLERPVDGLADDESVRPMLCKALHDPDIPERLAEKVRDVFIAAGSAAEDDVLNALVEELRTDHYAVRAWAVELILSILGGIGTEKTMQQLVELLTNDDSTVRINAVHSLQELGSEEYAKVLLPLLEDEDTDVRIEANEALEALTGLAAVEEYLDTRELGVKARRRWEELLEGR